MMGTAKVDEQRYTYTPKWLNEVSSACTHPTMKKHHQPVRILQLISSISAEIYMQKTTSLGRRSGAWEVLRS